MEIVKFRDFINEDHKFVSKKKTGEEISIPKEEFLKTGAEDGLKNMKIQRNTDGTIVAKIVESNLNLDVDLIKKDMQEYYDKHIDSDETELIEYIISKYELNDIEDDRELSDIAKEIIK